MCQNDTFFVQLVVELRFPPTPQSDGALRFESGNGSVHGMIPSPTLRNVVYLEPGTLAGIRRHRGRSAHGQF